MNANELADELNKNAKEERQDFWSDESGWCDVLEKAAIMLRQQQAEIETLKKDNKELHAIAQRMAMAESDARKSLQWFKEAQEK